jgi:hypothetical protein
MKRLPLALLVLLLGAVETATADYVLIVANLGRPEVKKEKKPATPPLPPGGGGLYPQPGGGVTFGGGGPSMLQTNPNQNIPGLLQGAPGGPSAAPFDPDTVPLMTMTVIEIEKKLGKLDVQKAKLGLPIGPVPFKLAGFDGKIALAKTSISSVEILHPNDKPTPPLHSVYEAKLKDLVESKTPVAAEQWVSLAEWSLGHGMLDAFKQHMDKAAEIERSLPKVAAYLEMKAALGKPVNDVDVVGPWRKQLLSTRYETYKSPHYALLSDDKPAAEARIKRLETAIQNYYYWFAMQRVQLPVPTQRLVGILTRETKTFKQLNSTLDSTPVVCDAFYARRENLAVFSSRRLDDAYDRLEKFASPLWTQGFDRELLLKGKGTPTGRGAVVSAREVLDAQALALLLKAAEMDGEVSGTQYGATRQLLYASGFLPPAVSPPEWVGFGMASFFATSPGSPWPTVGLPSFYYGPLFKDLVAAKKLPPDQLDLLRATVTDDMFRNPPAGLKKDAALRRSRATAWSLVHFLVRKRLEGLQRYFKELSQMPRDVALDDNQLWRAFARAFNAVDASGEPDQNALRTLADDWDKDMKIDQYEIREIELMRTIRLAYQAAATAQEQAGVAPPPGAAPGAGGGGANMRRRFGPGG